MRGRRGDRRAGAAATHGKRGEARRRREDSRSQGEAEHRRRSQGEEEKEKKGEEGETDGKRAEWREAVGLSSGQRAGGGRVAESGGERGRKGERERMGEETRGRRRKEEERKIFPSPTPFVAPKHTLCTHRQRRLLLHGLGADKRGPSVCRKVAAEVARRQKERRARKDGGGEGTK